MKYLHRRKQNNDCEEGLPALANQSTLIESAEKRVARMLEVSNEQDLPNFRPLVNDNMEHLQIKSNQLHSQINPS